MIAGVAGPTNTLSPELNLKHESVGKSIDASVDD
jgi:hypothetical protein